MPFRVAVTRKLPELGERMLSEAERRGEIQVVRWPNELPPFPQELAKLIHGADGAKLSKRHGATGVEAYRDELGILPEALFNYLLRLGWGHGDREEFTPAEATEVFDLDGIGKSPSRFDLKKLQNLNGHYIRAADDARLAQLIAPRIDPAADVGLLTEAMPVLKTRARDLNELADGAAFLFKSRPLALTEPAQALLTGDGKWCACGIDQAVQNRLEIERLTRDREGCVWVF